MQKADLVLAVGTSLHVIANYFDPWDAESVWAKQRPKGLRDKGKGPCLLCVVNRGDVCDEELAALKIECDVDVAMSGLLGALEIPPPPAHDPSDDPLAKAAIEPEAGEPRAPWAIEFPPPCLPPTE